MPNLPGFDVIAKNNNISINQSNELFKYVMDSV